MDPRPTLAAVRSTLDWRDAWRTAYPCDTRTSLPYPHIPISGLLIRARIFGTHRVRAGATHRATTARRDGWPRGSCRWARKPGQLWASFAQHRSISSQLRRLG